MRGLQVVSGNGRERRKAPKPPIETPELLEVFARGLAAGLSQTEAYLTARPEVGRVRAARRAAHLIKRYPAILRRADELRHQAELEARQRARTQEQVARVDRVYVLVRLTEIVERCMQHEPVRDKSGKPLRVTTPEGEAAALYRFDATGAANALRLIGAELGMFGTAPRTPGEDPLERLPAATVQRLVDYMRAAKEAALASRRAEAIDAIERTTNESETASPESTEGAESDGQGAVATEAMDLAPVDEAPAGQRAAEEKGDWKADQDQAVGGAV